MLCFSVLIMKQNVFLRFNLSVCFPPQAALQAGLGRTVSDAVTAVMAECVTLQPATVPAVWAGLVLTARKVTALTLNLFLVFAPASAHYLIFDLLINLNVETSVVMWLIFLTYFIDGVSLF